MSLNLYQASQQWASRPDDERFSSLDAMTAACKAYYENRREAVVPFSTLRTEAGATANAGDVMLVGKNAIPATMTHWSFGQLCHKLGAPAGYLRGLSATLAAQNLNYHLARFKEEDQVNLLFHDNGKLVFRAMASGKYSRIWNYQICERLQALVAADPSWRVPPARPAHQGQAGTRLATQADILAASDFGLSVRLGDLIAPAGLYASDHDMFAFMINQARRIDDGSPEGLSRGFFISNAEVPGRAWHLTRFLFRHVCGNHIVWDASQVKELRLIHIGDAPEKAWAEIRAYVRAHADSSAREEEAHIAHLQTAELGIDRDSVLDAVFKLGLGISKPAIADAYDIVDNETYQQDGSPRSPWGMAQGLTRVSQKIGYADERNDLDRAAGKLIALDF